MTEIIVRQRGEIVYPEALVVRRIGELAAQQAIELRHLDLVLVPLYRGAQEFTNELIKQYGLLDNPYRPPIAPMKVSRYDGGQARIPRVEIPVQIDVAGKVPHIVDEIIEGGHSMDEAERDLRERGAIDVVRTVLVKRTSKGAALDYVGFDYDGEEWLEGWGADDGEGQGRERRDIIISYRQPGDN